MQRKPAWLRLSDDLLWPVVGMGLTTLQKLRANDPNANLIPYLALVHFAHCLESSMQANREGKHSVAICLVRQCIETLTLIDIGLQDDAFARPLIVAWGEDKKSHGELRASLEKHIWPRYGNGLWDEPWTEYFGNLARAVQPYAHYTYKLQGWQLAVISSDTHKMEYLSLVGLQTYDPLKASRITLFHSLVGWTLGRLLLAHGANQDVLQRAKHIEDLGRALGRSKLLFKSKDWGTELLADVLFKPGVDWLDE